MTFAEQIKNSWEADKMSPYEHLTLINAADYIVGSIELCPESIDSAIEITLCDGSTLLIGNPDEVIFPGMMQL